MAERVNLRRFSKSRTVVVKMCRTRPRPLGSRVSRGQSQLPATKGHGDLLLVNLIREALNRERRTLLRALRKLVVKTVRECLQEDRYQLAGKELRQRANSHPSQPAIRVGDAEAEPHSTTFWKNPFPRQTVTVGRKSESNATGSKSCSACTSRRTKILAKLTKVTAKAGKVVSVPFFEENELATKINHLAYTNYDLLIFRIPHRRLEAAGDLEVHLAASGTSWTQSS